MRKLSAYMLLVKKNNHLNRATTELFLSKSGSVVSIPLESVSCCTDFTITPSSLMHVLVEIDIFIEILMALISPSVCCLVSLSILPFLNIYNLLLMNH